MASLSENFNADGVDPRMTEFALIPDGVYRLEVTESDVVPTKAGDGEIIKLTYRVVEGDHEGSTIWGNINYKNKNPKAQEIAQREFSALCHAVGVLAVNDTEELHYKSFTAKVGTEPAKGEYKAKNKIVKIFWDGEDAPPAGATAPSAPSTPKETPKAAVIAATAGAKPAGARPWARK